MGETEDQVNDVTLSSPEVTFDNLTILKEFSNVANLVSIADINVTLNNSSVYLAELTILLFALFINKIPLRWRNISLLEEVCNLISSQFIQNEDFLETVPKAKLRRVKWVPMFNCLKQGIFDEMVQEITSMWEFENMPEKLEELDKQKEKFAEMNPDNIAWRPQHDNIKSQLRASDVANLRKQKILLESLAKEYEVRASKLKKTVTAKRSYLKALQMDIQKYQKKNEENVAQITDKIKNHEHLVNLIETNKINIGDINWAQKKMDV